MSEMQTKQAYAAVQNMRNLFGAFQHIEGVLAKLLSAEQLTTERAEQARVLGLEIERAQADLNKLEGDIAAQVTAGTRRLAQLAADEAGAIATAQERLTKALAERQGEYNAVLAAHQSAITEHNKLVRIAERKVREAEAEVQRLEVIAEETRRKLAAV